MPGLVKSVTDRGPESKGRREDSNSELDVISSALYRSIPTPAFERPLILHRKSVSVARSGSCPDNHTWLLPILEQSVG